MTFSTEFFANQQYFLSVISSLINDEGRRIVASGLASKEEMQKFLNAYINALRSRIVDGKEVHGNYLSGLHLQLKAVKLPGDFKALSADEKFYEALDIPYTGEKFYDLSSLKEKKEEPKVEKLQEALEEFVEEDKEQHLEDCACDGCMDNMIKSQMALAQSVNDHLAKIAYHFGVQGDHDTAYMIEKTMRSIKVFASNGKLLDTNNRRKK